MKIKSILNNNAVLVRTDDGKEAIVVEKGIGFHHKVGDLVTRGAEQKIFVKKSEKSFAHFKELVLEIPYEVFRVCQEIYAHVKDHIPVEVDISLMVTLADHVNNSIRRIGEGIFYRNLLAWDTKLLYAQEYALGEWACGYIKEQLGYDFGPDEATALAMHIVNAERGKDYNVADTVIEAQAILRIIRYRMFTDFDTQSLAYYRFMVHIKFLIERVKNKTETALVFAPDIYKELIVRYEAEYRCAKKVAEYLEEKYSYEMSHDEVLYLLLHIVRLMDSAIE